MNDEAKRRLEALEFWRRQGIRAAADHAGVSERTLLHCHAAYRRKDKRGLETGSLRPRHAEGQR